MSEIITYAKLGISVIILLSNNSKYEMIASRVRAKYGDEDMVNIANAIVPAGGGRFKYSALAEIVGGYGEEVDKIEDIVPALKRAAARGGISVISVHTEANMEVISPITASFYTAIE